MCDLKLNINPNRVLSNVTCNTKTHKSAMLLLAAYVGDGLSEVDLMTQTCSKVGCDVIKSTVL